MSTPWRGYLRTDWANAYKITRLMWWTKGKCKFLIWWPPHLEMEFIKKEVVVTLRLPAFALRTLALGKASWKTQLLSFGKPKPHGEVVGRCCSWPSQLKHWEFVHSLSTLYHLMEGKESHPEQISCGRRFRSNGWKNQILPCATTLQSCVTLCNPMDCSLPDSTVHGILQARILEWVAMLPSRGSSWPRDWTCVSFIGRWVLYF